MSPVAAFSASGPFRPGAGAENGTSGSQSASAQASTLPASGNRLPGRPTP